MDCACGAMRQGPILIDSTWHLFADSIQRGVRGLFWAHATSQDLVNWKPASNFVTGSGSTGSIVPYDDNDNASVTYHAIDGFGSHHTAENSSLNSWTRQDFVTTAQGHASNPGDPAGLFRVGDPSRPFKYGDEWFMVVGGGANGGNGTYAAAEARLYKAQPLLHPRPPFEGNVPLSNWSYVGIMFASNVSAPNPNSWGPWNPQNRNTGMWECIDFFRMGDSKWMLMTSQITEGNDAYERHPQKLTEAYWIGDFDGRHFTPLQGHEVGRAVDFGYVAAAKTGADLRNSEASSRRVFFGWNDVWTRFHGATIYANGNWKQFSPWGSVTQPFGSQTLPRDFWLDPTDGESSLRMAPVPELQSLRMRGHGNECHFSRSAGSVGASGSGDGGMTIGSSDLDCAGRQIELNATIELTSASSEAVIAVLASTDKQEATLIRINSTMLALDRTNSSLTPDATVSADPARVRNWFPQNRTTLFAPLVGIADTRRAEASGGSYQYNLRVYVDGRCVFPLSATTLLILAMFDVTFGCI